MVRPCRSTRVVVRQEHVQLEIISRHPSSGNGAPPLLFVHGAFHGAWCWDVHFLDYFAARGFTAHAVSLRGHGHSDGRSTLRRARVAGYVEDVEWAAAQLPTAPILIGHSMGGLIVEKVLERRPAPAAVLLSPPPPRRVLKSVVRIAARHPRPLVEVILTRKMWPLVATPALAHDALFSDDMPDDLVKDYWNRLQDESFRAFVGMLTVDRPDPSKVRTPVYVLGGADDRLITPREIEATARAYGAPFEVLAGLAHDLMLDTRWPTVASRIVAWLTGLGLAHERPLTTPSTTV